MGRTETKTVLCFLDFGHVIARLPPTCMNVRIGPEPPGKTDSRRITLKLCDLMLKVPGNSENHGISKACVSDFAYDPACADFANLQNAAAKRCRAEIKAHGDQPAGLIEIVMPVKDMRGVRNEFIDSSVKTAHRTTRRDFLNEIKKFQIV